MTPLDIVRELIRRIEANPERVARVTAQEYRQWTEAARQLLQNEKLLQPASPAAALFCPGCHQHCWMAVESFKSQTFIICDKEDGPDSTIDLDPADLHRWQSSLSAFALLLGRLLATTRTPVRQGGDEWLLGVAKSGRQRYRFVLGFESDRLVLKAGEGWARVIDCLSATDDRLSIDHVFLRQQLSRNKTATRYVPDRTRQQLRKEATRAKRAQWNQAYQRIKADLKTAHLRDEQIAYRISKMDIAEGASCDTIRRWMKSVEKS